MDYDNEAVDWDDDEIEEIQPPPLASNFRQEEPDHTQDDIEDTVSLGEEEDSTFYAYQDPTTGCQPNGAQQGSRMSASRSPSPRRPRRGSVGASQRRSPNPTSRTDRSRATNAQGSTGRRRPADSNSSNPSPTRSNLLARPLHALPAKPQVARPATPPAPIYAVTSMIGDSPRQNRDGKRPNGPSVAQNSPPTDTRPLRGSRRASSVDDDHRYREPETLRDHPDSVLSPPHEPSRRTGTSATSSSRHTRRPSPGPLPAPPYVAPTLSAEDRHYEPSRDAHSRHMAPSHSRPQGRPPSPPPLRRRSRSGSPPGDRFFAPRDPDFNQARKTSGPERRNDPDPSRSNQPNTGRAWEASYYTPAYGPSGQPRRRQDEDPHRPIQDDRIPVGSNRHRDESRPRADAASYPPPRRRSPSPHRQPLRADHSPPPSNYRRLNEPSSFDRDGSDARRQEDVRFDRPPLGPNGPSAHEDPRYYRPRSPSPPPRSRPETNRRPTRDDDLDRGPNPQAPRRQPRPPPQTDPYGSDSRGPPPRLRERDPLPHIANQSATDRSRESGPVPVPRNERRSSGEDRPRERERGRSIEREQEREVNQNPRGYTPRENGDSIPPHPRRRSPGPPPLASSQQQRPPTRYAADGLVSPAPPRGPARTAVSPHRGLPENVPRGPAAGTPPVGPRARARVGGGDRHSGYNRPPPDGPMSRLDDKPKPQLPTQPAGWSDGSANDGVRRTDEDARRAPRRGGRLTSSNSVPLGQRRPNNQPPPAPGQQQQQSLPSQSQSQESVGTNDSRQGRSNADLEMMRPASPPPPSVPSSVNSSQEVYPPPRPPSPPRAANDAVKNAYQKIRRIRSEKVDKPDDRMMQSRQDRDRGRRDAPPPRSRGPNESSSHKPSTLDYSPDRDPHPRNDHLPPPLSDNAYTEASSRRQPPPLAAPSRDSYHSMSTSTSSQSQSQSQPQLGLSRRGGGDVDGRNEPTRYGPSERERELEREKERERLRERERERERERDEDRERDHKRDRPNGALPLPSAPPRYPNGTQPPLPEQNDSYPPHPSTHPPPLLDRFSERVQTNDRDRVNRSDPPSRTHSPTSPRLPPLVSDRYLPDKNSNYRRGGRVSPPPGLNREDGPPSLAARIYPRVDVVGVASSSSPRDAYPPDREREREKQHGGRGGGRDERDRGVRDREREREREKDRINDNDYDREGRNRDHPDRNGFSRPPGPNNHGNTSASSTVVNEHYRREEMEVDIIIHPPSRSVTQGVDVDRHYKQYPNLPFHHSLPPRPQSMSLLNRIGNGTSVDGNADGDGDRNPGASGGDVGMSIERDHGSPSSQGYVKPDYALAEDGQSSRGGGATLQDRVVPSKRDRDDVMLDPGLGRAGDRYDHDPGRGDVSKRPRRAGRRAGGGGGGGGGGRRRGERGSVGV